MRVTIIVDDNMVFVEGKSRRVDCAALVANNIHAVQWYADIGEIEFGSVFNPDTKTLMRQPNQSITDFSSFQTYVDAWQIENAAQELIELEYEEQHARNLARNEEARQQNAALMLLPQDVQMQMMAEKSAALAELAAITEQKRVEHWQTLSPEQQQQIISQAKGSY